MKCAGCANSAEDRAQTPPAGDDEMGLAHSGVGEGIAVVAMIVDMRALRNEKAEVHVVLRAPDTARVRRRTARRMRVYERAVRESGVRLLYGFEVKVNRYNEQLSLSGISAPWLES
jgi:hypothetical protein